MVGVSTCDRASAEECTRRALSEWSKARDDRTVSCVARMFESACSYGDAGACFYIGRLRLDGRGVDRDEQRGIDTLVRACDDGVAPACMVGSRWLADPVHSEDRPDATDLRARLETERACLEAERTECYQVGLSFYFGRDAFPKDRVRAAGAYQRGCDLGDARACNNLADALAYGEGVGRDLARSASLFDRACRLGEALGCSNSGLMFEMGMGVLRDRARARELYRGACVSGDIYGCLHAEMLSAQDAGAPRDSQQALVYWGRACARGIAKACAYVGIIYEDGPDGLTRDGDKSLEAMKRACRLGDERACEWVKEHP